MRGYYTQNVAVTCAIIVLSLGAVCFLSVENPALVGHLQDNSSTVRFKEKQFFPGDERTGVPDRLVAYSEDGLKKSVTAVFKDQAQVHVEFDSLERPLKALETLPNKGGTREATFNPKSRELQKVRYLRPDGTRGQETTVAREAIETVSYNDQGTLKLRSEKINPDGSFEIALYWEGSEQVSMICRGAADQTSEVIAYQADGVTVKSVCKHVKDQEYTVKSYNESGVLVRDVILVSNLQFCESDGCNPCHECSSSSYKITCYADDGKKLTRILRRDAEQSPLPVEGGPNYLIKEYQDDGKNLRRMVYFPAKNDIVPPEGTAKVLDVFTPDSKLSMRSYFKCDDSVLRDETYAADGTVEVSYPLGGRKAIDETVGELTILVDEECQAIALVEAGLYLRAELVDLSRLQAAFAE
ncbi:MAG: hypothetical protein K2W82_10650 [Candidatus Obscuribacterales bacterium]|nr:hypothetical protein [Candidatus Obscuribacterales bacterium]